MLIYVLLILLALIALLSVWCYFNHRAIDDLYRQIKRVEYNNDYYAAGEGHVVPFHRVEKR